MNHKQQKFENPVRLEELKPLETLKRIGFHDGMTLCDIGAGTGIFTLPAAEISGEKVYALEISDDMLDILREKVEAGGMENIQLIKVHSETLEVETGGIDVALMVTVFHEIEEKTVMLAEVNRMLKADGRFAIIEFHKRATPMGPELDHRISKGETQEELTRAGFVQVEDMDLGENFYCLVFAKQSGGEVA